MSIRRESAYRVRVSQPTTWDMRKRLALNKVLDKHRVTCPRCGCPEAVVLIDAQFNVDWQCVDCELRWAASGDETTLLLGSSLKTVH